MNKLHPYIMPGIVVDDKQYWWHLKDKVTANMVMDVVAGEYNISFDVLFDSSSRSGPVEARGLCYFILIHKLGFAQKKVADEFGKNRGTLFHTIKRIKWLLKNNKSAYNHFFNIKKKIEKEINSFE